MPCHELVVSTTVDAALLSRARRHPHRHDRRRPARRSPAGACWLGYRAAEIDASYAVYDEHPLDEPDEWGDLHSFRRRGRRDVTTAPRRGELWWCEVPDIGSATGGGAVTRRSHPAPAPSARRSVHRRRVRGPGERSAARAGRRPRAEAQCRQPGFRRERRHRHARRTTRCAEREPHARGLRRARGCGRLRPRDLELRAHRAEGLDDLLVDGLGQQVGAGLVQVEAVVGPDQLELAVDVRRSRHSRR